MAWHEPKTTKQEREQARKDIESIPLHLRQYRGIAYTFWLNLLDDIEASETLNKAFLNDAHKKQDAKTKDIQEENKRKPAVAPLPCEEVVLTELYDTTNMVSVYQYDYYPADNTFAATCKAYYGTALFEIVSNGSLGNSSLSYEAVIYANNMPVSRLCEIPFLTDMDIKQTLSKLLSWWMIKYVIKPHEKARAVMQEAEQWSKLVRMKPNK